MTTKDALRSVWAQIILGFIIGLVLSLVPETCSATDRSWICTEVPDFCRLSLHHIGIGLIVASFVTCFWQIREFLDFFEKMAELTLIKHDYLANLKQPILVDIRHRADEAIMSSVIENKNYDRQSLGKSIDSSLYSRLMPERSRLSGCYRKNYVERIVAKEMTLREILNDSGIPLTERSEEELDTKYLRMISETTYTVVMPILQDSEYWNFPLSFESLSAELPFLPPSLQTRMWAGHKRDQATELTLRASVSGGGGVEFKIHPEEAVRLPVTNGECEVFTRLVEFKRPSESFALNIMAHLTQGMRATLLVEGGADFGFDANVIATGPAKRDPIYRGIELLYEDWLFENNADFVWWWENSNMR